MKLLEERIRKDGVVKEGNVLKVDSFLNHQMDVPFFYEMGKEFKRLFQDPDDRSKRYRYCDHCRSASECTCRIC